MPAIEHLTTRLATDIEAQERRDKRASQRPARRRGDPRSPSRRDRDKVLYAAAFQRLTGVTQVVTPEPGGALTHNRLTHSLKVAQVARSIAELLLSDATRHPALLSLGGLDADVAEAAALAHDLGHPPFGHIGETVLDSFARTDLELFEGFEGNAQTFRVLTRLDARAPKYDGMDLTAATRCAVLKYPWHRVKRGDEEEAHRERLEDDASYELRWKKFGYYAEEETDFAQARSIPGVKAELQSVEAAIMDLADDVTYALHDLQDFYLARILPIPLVLKELEGYSEKAKKRGKIEPGGDGTAFVSLAEQLARKYDERYEQDELARAVNWVHGWIRASFAYYFDATRDAAANVNKAVSELIGYLITHVRITEEPTGQRAAVYLPDDLWHQVQVLKHLTSQQVIGRPDMAVYQRAQQHILKDLLLAMKAWWDDDDDQRRLPQPLLEWRERAADENREPRRCLIDFVAGLSDHQAASLRRALADGGQGLIHSLVL